MHSGIRGKIIALALASIAITALALTAVSAWRSQAFADSTAENIDSVVQQNLDRTAENVYDVVSSQGESISDRVAANMSVASAALGRAGGLRLGTAPVTWQAKNQVDQKVTTVTLPQALAGTTWLGQQKSAKVAVPVVDEVEGQVGGAITIFQKMNDQGDMLRVATTVKGADGNRATGTYIPARNADGTPNPVIAAAVAGKPYVGVAQVVGQWYVTKYQPIIRDGRLIGLLFVGYRQESVEALRDAIEQTKVGDGGKVEVIGTKAAARGSSG